MLSNAVLAIVDVILNSKLNEQQLVLALRKASTHHSVRRIFKSAGLIDIPEYKIMMHLAGQMKGIMAIARTTEKKQGRANDDKCGLVEAVMLAVSTPPPLTGDSDDAPSHSTIAKLFGIPKTTTRKLLKTAFAKRRL